MQNLSQTPTRHRREHSPVHIAPAFQGRIDLVVRTVGSPAEVNKGVIPGVGDKYLPGCEDLRGQRGWKQFLLVLCSQVRNCHRCNRKSYNTIPRFMILGIVPPILMLLGRTWGMRSY